jgi:hypothetical protein
LGATLLAGLGPAALIDHLPKFLKDFVALDQFTAFSLGRAAVVKNGPVFNIGGICVPSRSLSFFGSSGAHARPVH